MANGATQAYTVTVTAPATGTLLNIVASTSSTLDSDPANNNGSLPAARVTTIVQERADVVTTKTGPATVNAAAQFSYTITTRNVGPSAAAAVVVSDTLPATVTFVSATGGGVLAGNVVTWPVIPSLASGAAQSYDVTVTAPATGSFTNIIASTSATPDPVPANNDGSDPASRVTTTVSELADVATSKSGPGAGQRQRPGQLHHHRHQHRTECGDGSARVRPGAGGRHLRERLQRRRAQRGSGAVAGDQLAGCGPDADLRAPGAGAAERHAHQRGVEHRDHHRSGSGQQQRLGCRRRRC